MKSKRLRRTVLPLGLAGCAAIAVAAGISLSPESVVAKPAPDKIVAEARKALGSGQYDKAIRLGEDLVAANPQEPSYRAILGQAYLRAGRFESAAQALDDAMKLGDSSARTALSLALAQSGMGRDSEAVAILNDWRDAIPAADLGLAYAMAGEAPRGVAILVEALRGGENTPKLRQNLAYAYALDGRWREARLMAAQDVPADKLDARISSWAARAKPEDSRLRVAGLLGAPLRSDAGMPAQLALSASRELQQLAAESTAPRSAPAVAANGELPPASESAAELSQYRPTNAPAPVAAAPVRGPAITFVSNPVIQSVPASLPGHGSAVKAKRASASLAGAPGRTMQRPAAKPRAVQTASITKGSSHAVQLGSFFSEQGARRAWGQYVARNPELRNFNMVITSAKVRGKTYWRVAAGGLDLRSAGGLCGKVKARGGMCFAYAITGKPANAPVYARKAPAAKVPAVALAGPARRK